MEPIKYEEAIDFEHLYESAIKCKSTVIWKESTSHYMLNVVREIDRLNEKLSTGTYVPREPNQFTITNPKERHIISIPFVDRVYQRSLNDNILYPVMTKSLIYDNCACQTGKGTDFARNRLKTHLGRFYRKYKLEGYVLQIDIHKYYPSMSHDYIEGLFKKKLDKDTYRAVEEILKHQYKGDVGYNPRQSTYTNCRNFCIGHNRSLLQRKIEVQTIHQIYG